MKVTAETPTVLISQWQNLETFKNSNHVLDRHTKIPVPRSNFLFKVQCFSHFSDENMFFFPPLFFLMIPLLSNPPKLLQNYRVPSPDEAIRKSYGRAFLFEPITARNTCMILKMCTLKLVYAASPALLLLTSDSNHQTILKCVSYIFLEKKIFFNWRIIVLQCCVSFCRTSTCINHQYTYVPASWTSLPPLWVVTEHQVELPASYSNSHQLSLLHAIMCMCQCCCLNSSLSLLPLQFPQVCSLCLRLYSCTANRFIGTIFLDSIHMC